MFKRLLFLSCFTLLFCGVISKSAAQSISSVVVTSSSGSIPASGYCAGQGLQVSFTATGFTGTPTFSIQLSDAAGVFPAIANIIGTGTTSPASAVIPVGTTAGTGYKIRVTSGLTVSVGSASFQINPVATVSVPNNATVCSGVSTSGYSFNSYSSGATFSWTSSTNIGFGTSGTGNINSYVPVNNSTSNVTANITVTPSVNGCPGIPSTFSIIVRPGTRVNPISPVNLCNGATGAAINFSSPTTETTFTWTSTANVGFGTSGSGNIPAYIATNTGSSPVTATVTVTPTSSTCTGPTQSFTVTVNPTNSTVNQVSSVTYCDDASASTITFSSPSAGATFDWTSSTNIGFGTSGSGNIPAFIANNNGNADVTATVVVTPKVGGCSGTPMTFSITVRHKATVTPISNINTCQGSTNSAINFFSPSTGATFSWTSSINVGFGTSGTGSNIPSFTAINATSSVQTATVTVTPTVGGCVGTSTTFTVTVNPATSVNTVSNAFFCGGLSVAGVTFSSPVAGTTYSWTSDVNVGFGTSGTGNIPSYTTINTNTTPLVATVTVTPTIGSCPGTSKTFTVTVNPSPRVSTVSNVVYCNTAPGLAITFSSPVSGTTYTWTSSVNIGFGVSGTGNIPTYTATNTTANQIITPITVTPSTGTCTGPASVFTITVNPTPVVSTVANATYCGNTSATAIPFTSTTAGTTYAWTSTSNVGFGTSGAGSIAAYTTIDSESIVLGNITVTPTANTCVGASKTFTITVNPTPKVNTVSNVTYCNAASGAAIPFTSPTSGSTYTWSSSSNVGFGVSGSGAIPAFTVVNTGSVPLISTVSVTAKTATCTGSTQVFTVTANPTPTVTALSNLTYCGAVTAPAILFTSLTPSTTYAWTSTSNVGFGTMGTGNITSYNVSNPVAAATTATVSVIPTANTCVGTASRFTITINPSPIASVATDTIICAGTKGNAITFSSGTPSTTYSWSTPTNVGFGTSGTGSITAGFTALNSSQNVVSTLVSVIPSTSTCTGKVKTFTFVVNPTPASPTSTSPVVYCATAIATPLVASGTNIKWYNVSIGGTGSGVAPTPSTNNPADTSATTRYYVTQTNQYTCESQRTQIQVVVKPLPPSPSVSKQEYLLCQFDPAIQLDAKVQGTGQSLLWIYPNTRETAVVPTITTDTGFEETYSVLQLRDGCRGPRTDIKVNVRTTPLPSVSQTPIIVCQNATPQALTAVGTNLKWYNTNKTGGTGQTTPNIPPTQTPGTYFFYVTQTGANGCESPRAEVAVVIQSLPSATISGEATITQGQSAPLSIAFTGQGPWTYTLSNGLTFTSSQNPTTITVSPLEPTVYTVTKISNNCGEGSPAGSATINVRVATIDVGNPNPTTICAGQTLSIPYFSSDFFPSNAQFRVQISKTSDDASFQTIPSEGVTTPLTATVPTTTTAGTYYVRVIGVTSNFTVKSKVSPVQIVIRELPTATISGPASIYENESAKLSIAFTGENPWRVTYRDSLAQKDTTFSATISPYEFTVRPAKTNVYRIVSISNGCGNGPATSRLTLTVAPLLSVTPNQSNDWLSVYPVPVQTRCTIEIEGGTPASITVTDGYGRVLLRQQTATKREEVDFTTLAPGVYFLNAEQNGRIAQRKVVKVQ